MAQNIPASGLPRPSFKNLAVFVTCLALVLLGLFYRSLLPGYVIASNDAPLGVMSQASQRVPRAVV